MRIFKKEKKLLKCTKDLIYANHEGNIKFKRDFPEEIISFVEQVIRENLLLDDKLYPALLEEYQRYYVAYDRWPMLLYFRIPTIAQDTYEPELLLKEPLDALLDIDVIESNIPDSLRIPPTQKVILQECLNQSLPYMAEHIREETFGKWLEFKWLSEWPLYKENSMAYTVSFGSSVCDRIINTTEESNKTVVTNIIQRILQRKIAEYSN